MRSGAGQLAVLEALGASMADVLNLTVYLQDIRHLLAVAR